VSIRPDRVGLAAAPCEPSVRVCAGRRRPPRGEASSFDGQAGSSIMSIGRLVNRLEVEMEERRPLDPTRRLLRVFGVKVTEYEERTAGLLERAAAATEPEQGVQLAAEAIDLTVELNARLRDVLDHVLDTQGRVLTELRTALGASQT
jgi:hypothetical protein